MDKKKLAEGTSRSGKGGAVALAALKEVLENPGPKVAARSGKTAAVQAFTESVAQDKYDRIKKIMDDAAKALEAEGVKYFIGAVDRQPTEPDGGKAFCQSDATGEDFVHILDMALPTRQDAVNFGIWAGIIINARSNKNKS